MQSPILLKNTSGSAEKVLIFPITREIGLNNGKWAEILSFVQDSNIDTLIVSDKTPSQSGVQYFSECFNFDGKRLILLPRGAKDTLFDTVGEILLDENMWIMQLHDDDKWTGNISLPQVLDKYTVYFSNFYLTQSGESPTKVEDFSLPNRIVFSLVPTILWNKFVNLIQAYNYHVAGSFDYTFNYMAHILCKFSYQSGFNYYWNNDNWSTNSKSKKHLNDLSINDGWGEWALPELAIFNRRVDCLISLSYLCDLVGTEIIHNEIQDLIKSFKPTARRSMKISLKLVSLYLMRFMLCFVFQNTSANAKKDLLIARIHSNKFIKSSYGIKTITDLMALIRALTKKNQFPKLEMRFNIWQEELSKLKEFS